MNIETFIERAKPYSHWPDAYFRIRLNEYRLTNSLLDDIFEKGGGRFLDIGCGMGFACVYAAQYFDQVEGVDVDAVDVAFKVNESSVKVGARLVQDFPNIALHCADPVTFLKDRPDTYDFVFSHFVMEHVENLDPLCAAIYRAMKPGAKSVHIVPNTHDTICQLLLQNLQPIEENARNAKLAAANGERRLKLLGGLYAPITHSEFISDYRKQFDINSSERYVFPLIEAGFKIRRLLPEREHAYIILAEKP